MSSFLYVLSGRAQSTQRSVSSHTTCSLGTSTRRAWQASFKHQGTVFSHKQGYKSAAKSHRALFDDTKCLDRMQRRTKRSGGGGGGGGGCAMANGQPASSSHLLGGGETQGGRAHPLTQNGKEKEQKWNYFTQLKTVKWVNPILTWRNYIIFKLQDLIHNKKLN